MTKLLYGLGANVGFGVNTFCWFESGCEGVDFSERIECALSTELLFEICNCEEDRFDSLLTSRNVLSVVLLSIST